MSDAQFRQHIETIYQQMALLQGQAVPEQIKIAAALEGLQLLYEEMQTSLEAAEVIETKLIEQNQQVAASYQYYYDLFHTLPIAYLITDANGLIREANQAIAQLLNLPQSYLIGKPLALYVAEEDRRAFRTALNQVHTSSIQHCEITFSPRNRDRVAASVQIAAIAALEHHEQGTGSLGIAVYVVSQVELPTTSVSQHTEETAPTLPQSLDGLRVLVIDDEADARDFITAALESYGIEVTAVTTVAAALAALEEFRPDVLVSDIRMPDADGYSLIRRVRELEAEKGWHIPAAALTAYLTEDREKALSAGFEAHLHKLAQPRELIDLVAQLAGVIPESEDTRSEFE